MHIVILLFFIATTTLGEIVTERISIVNQLNVTTNDPTNKLVAQKFTDILPQLPRLYVMDDFVLPLNLSSNITIMQLSFTMIRLRRDADPDSISIVLMYNNPLTQGPGELFFTKTVRAPNNPPVWRNDSLGTHEVISLNITQGEQCALHPSVVFDFAEPTFLPRGVRLWLGFYVTGARHFVDAPTYAENIVFWCMTTETVADSWTANDDKLPNAPYFFIDESNILSKGLTNWSNATTIKTLLGIKSNSRNMAWSMTLLGVAPSSLLEILYTLSTKQIVAIVVCSILTLVILVLCVLCVCKQCRRCRIKRSSAANTVPSYDLGKRSNGVLYASSPDIQSTEILLESSESSIPLEKSTASGRYIHQVTHIPVRLDDDKKTGKQD